MVREMKGKINPRTKKPYTDDELWAMARAQYNKSEKKSFEVFMPVVKSWTDKVSETNDQRFFEVVVSGVKEDRDGEIMDDKAIEDMILQFKSGKIPLMPDHGKKSNGDRHYSWKDIMGVWVDAKRDGNNLLAVARLNKAHPDAETLWNFMQEGMPVGFSIGGRTVEVREEILEDTEADMEKTK
jgi:hypothetical protein